MEKIQPHQLILTQSDDGGISAEWSKNPHQSPGALTIYIKPERAKNSLYIKIPSVNKVQSLMRMRGQFCVLFFTLALTATRSARTNRQVSMGRSARGAV